jgi:hypothetical protein
MDIFTPELLSTALKYSGVSGILVFMVFWLVRKFGNTLASVTSQFMVFIKEERTEQNQITKENIAAMLVIRQEMAESTNIAKEHLKLITQLSHNIASLERQTNALFAQIQVQHAELLINIAKLQHKQSD